MDDGRVIKMLSARSTPASYAPRLAGCSRCSTGIIYVGERTFIVVWGPAAWQSLRISKAVLAELIMIANYSRSNAVNLDSASLFFGGASPTFAPFSFSFSAFLYCSE